MDPADLRTRSQSGRHHRRHAAELPGAPMKTTPARWACKPSPTSPAITTASTWKLPSATAGASGIAPTTQGVGMDRTVATGTGYIGQYRPAVAQMFEIAGDLPRRSAALPASRAVHLRAAFRQDGDPVHLRFALRRRGSGGGLRARSGNRSAGWSTSSVTSQCWRSSNIRPARPRSGATR